MNRQTFEKLHQERWQNFEIMLNQLDGKNPPARSEEFPAMFRQICSDLSLAQQRMYGLRLCERLNELVIRGHKHLYRSSSRLGEGMLRFIARDFPRAFREDIKLFWINSAFFFIPLAGLIIAAMIEPRWSHALLGTEMMSQLQSMYGSESPVEHLREEFGSNFKMFAFYVFNNIGIDFRIFAGGIFFGVGTLFFVVFNGLFFGAATAFIHEAANPESFYTFICGHASVEIMGMLVAGMAGLQIGLGIIRPGRRGRKQALLDSGKRATTFLYGAALLTFLAALIEGFWSATPTAPSVKYTVATFWFIALVAYFTFAGRNADEA